MRSQLMVKSQCNLTKGFALFLKQYKFTINAMFYSFSFLDEISQSGNALAVYSLRK